MVLNKQKIRDLVVWSILSALGLLVMFVLKPLVFIGVALSFLPGCIFLLLKTRKNLFQLLSFGFCIGVLCAVPFEYVNYLNNSWTYEDNEYLIANFIFGIPLEVVGWYFLWAFSVAQFYEYFVDETRKFIISNKLFWLVPVFLGWVAVYLSGESLTVAYAYLLTGIAATLPAVYFLLARKSIFAYKKFIVPTLFLSAHFLLKEFVALYHNYWSFSGEYLYVFTVFGKTLPIEEVFFWIIASPVILICYYELFFDDGK
jgi:hypothetical protein